MSVIALVAAGVGGHNGPPFLCGIFFHALGSTRGLHILFLGTGGGVKKGDKVVIIVVGAMAAFVVTSRVCMGRTRSAYVVIADIAVADPCMVGLHCTLQSWIFLIVWFTEHSAHVCLAGWSGKECTMHGTLPLLLRCLSKPKLWLLAC
jgi:hypothetical protein